MNHQLEIQIPIHLPSLGHRNKVIQNFINQSVTLFQYNTHIGKRGSNRLGRVRPCPASQFRGLSLAY